MGLFINSNSNSLYAQRMLFDTNNQLSTSLQRLSSGLRINSAADDAAGLQISDRLSAQLNGLKQGTRNANDGISLIQTAEGALSETTQNLQRLRQLTIQAGNGINSQADNNALQQEAQELLREIERIASTTTFAGTDSTDTLLLGLDKRKFLVGANAGQNITVDFTQNQNAGFGIGGLGLQGLDVANGQGGAVINSTTGDGLVPFIGWTPTDPNEEPSPLSIKGTLDNTTIFSSVSTLSAGTYHFGVSSNWGVNYTEVEVELSGQTSTDATTIVESINQEIGQDLLKFSGDQIITGQYEYAAGEDIADGYYSRFNISERSDNPTSGLTYNGKGPVRLDPYITAGVKEDALDVIDNALERVNGLRAELGAIENRFQSTLSTLSNSTENLSASRGRILDADFAAETAHLTRNQILQQSGVSVLAQANQAPELALSLLG